MFLKMNKNLIYEILGIITLSDLTHMMSMADHIAISVETLKIYRRCSLEKEFNELILKNS